MPEPYAIAAHLGQGNVLISLSTGKSEWFLYYETQISEDIAGPYYPYSNFQSEESVFVLRNVPTEITIYIQIREVTRDPEDMTGRVYGNWVQVRKGMLNKPKVMMECLSIEGSMISRGARFPGPIRNEEVVVFESLQEILFQE